MSIRTSPMIRRNRASARCWFSMSPPHSSDISWDRRIRSAHRLAPSASKEVSSRPLELSLIVMLRWFIQRVMVLSPSCNWMLATCESGTSAPLLEVSSRRPIASGVSRADSGNRTVVS